MRKYRRNMKIAIAVILATTCTMTMGNSILAKETKEVSVRKKETTLSLPKGVHIKNLGMQRIHATGSMNVVDHEYALTAEYVASPEVASGQTHLQTPHSGTIFGVNGTNLQGYSIAIPSPSAFQGEAVKAIAHSKGKEFSVNSGGTLSVLKDENFIEHHSFDGAIEVLTLEAGDKIKTTEHMTKVLHYPDGRLVFVNHTMDETINSETINNKDVIAQVVKANGNVVNIPNVGVIFTPKEADNAVYTPKAQDIYVKIGETPEAELGIVYEGENAPKNTTYAWKNGVVPSTTAAGNVTGTVVITYPDKTIAEVVVNVVVSSTDSGKYRPVGQPMVVALNGTLRAKDGIANANTLPRGTKYTWKGSTPSTATINEIKAVIVVTYPDASIDEVEVKITIGNYAQRHPATSKKVTVFVGEKVEAIEAIANIDQLPEGTSYAWKRKEPKTTSEGEIDAVVTVTYADGSKADINVKVEVVEKQAVKYPAIGQNIKVAVNDSLKIEDGIMNIEQMPIGVHYTWKDQTPSTTTPGEFAATILVSYQDQTTAEVTIQLIVGSDAQRHPAVGKNINVELNASLYAKDGIANADELDFLGVQAIEWGKELATDQEGMFPASITITYADGSKADVNIIVTVGGDVSRYEPVIKQETISQNETLQPEDFVTNKDTLPMGTKFTWKNAPDFTALKEQFISILITYPDGTSEEIETKLTVVRAKMEEQEETSSDEEVMTTPSQQPSDHEDGDVQESDQAPSTKDETQVGLWSMMMAVAIGVIYFLRKKNKRI